MRPNVIHLSQVAPGLKPQLEPLAVDGRVAIPTFQRLEVTWPPSRIPAWFYRVPGKRALKWTRRDGSVGPHYAERIVQDLLFKEDGVGLGQVLGRQASVLARAQSHGPIEVRSSRAAGRLMGMIDRMLRRGHGPTADGHPRRMLGHLRLASGPPVGYFSKSRNLAKGFSENQPTWLAASLAAGVPFESFAVVEGVLVTCASGAGLPGRRSSRADAALDQSWPGQHHEDDAG